MHDLAFEEGGRHDIDFKSALFADLRCTAKLVHVHASRSLTLTVPEARAIFRCQMETARQSFHAAALMAGGMDLSALEQLRRLHDENARPTLLVETRRICSRPLEHKKTGVLALRPSGNCFYS